jgi:shikimate kinase
MAGAGAPIFLIGFMASGKTTVGKLVAERLGRSFQDLDRLIVAGAGRTVADIFAVEGEAGFRRRERAALESAAALEQAVVATGGGAAASADNLDFMLGAGRVVALRVSPAEAVRRAGTRSGRPLLDRSGDPPAAARALLAARQPFYERAHLSVETDGRSPVAIAEAVIAGLGMAPAPSGS